MNSTIFRVATCLVAAIATIATAPAAGPPSMQWAGPSVEYTSENHSLAAVASCDASCDDCGPVCDCDSCDSAGQSAACQIDHIPILLPVLRLDWKRFEFGAGSMATTGPLPNLSGGDGGHFGYQQHFNEGRELRRLIGLDIATQFGVRLTQLNLGNGDGPAQKRNQTFVTGGLFRRVDYGLQYGVVADYLHDEWVVDFDIVQARGEISWVTDCHNFGVMFAVGSSDDVVQLDNATTTIEAVDQLRGFYRRRISPDGGAWTTFIGGTSEDHLVLGSDVDLPVTDHLSLQVGSTYFAADDAGRLPEAQSTGWNLSIGMVFRPGFGLKANRYRRPLLDVADNGTMFLTRR